MKPDEVSAGKTSSKWIPNFILFFPTMVAGLIKRYQQFLPKLRSDPSPWPNEKVCHRGCVSAYANHLNHADLAVANRAILPVWLLAYGIKIYRDSQRLGALCGNVNQPNSCGKEQRVLQEVYASAGHLCVP
jgi:hypothetical protein